MRQRRGPRRQIGNLAELESVRLDYSGFGGYVPTQLGALAKLAEGNATAQKRMRELVLDLLNVMIASMDITDHVPLIKRLLKLAGDAEGTDYYQNTILHIRVRAGETEAEASRRGGQAGVRQRDALIKVNNLIPPGKGPRVK